MYLKNCKYKVKNCFFVAMCNAHNKVTHIKQQKYFHHLKGRGYPRPLKWWKYFLLFYMCHVAMGLTHCYKKTAVFYIYILKKIIKHDSVLVVSFCGCVCMLACRCDKSWTFRCIITLFLLEQDNCKIMCVASLVTAINPDFRQRSLTINDLFPRERSRLPEVLNLSLSSSHTAATRTKVSRMRYVQQLFLAGSVCLKL